MKKELISFLKKCIEESEDDRSFFGGLSSDYSEDRYMYQGMTDAYENVLRYVNEELSETNYLEKENTHRQFQKEYLRLTGEFATDEAYRYTGEKRQVGDEIVEVQEKILIYRSEYVKWLEAELQGCINRKEAIWRMLDESQ